MRIVDKMTIIDKKPCGNFNKCNGAEGCQDCSDYENWTKEILELIKANLPNLEEYYEGKNDDGDSEWDYDELADDIFGILENN